MERTADGYDDEWGDWLPREYEHSPRRLRFQAPPAPDPIYEPYDDYDRPRRYESRYGSYKPSRQRPQSIHSFFEGPPRSRRSKDFVLRCHPYNTPINSYGDDLSIDVYLRGIDPNSDSHLSASGPWTWPAQSGENGSRTKPLHLARIANARRYFGIEEQHLLDLACVPKQEGTLHAGSKFTKWLYGNASSSKLFI